MKSAKFKKIAATVMALSIIASTCPMGVSAAWKQDSNGWWNDKESSYSVEWENINNTWYYFGQDGYMKTGWINNNGTWYYTDASGAMKTGWINDNGSWYYTDNSGAMKTGWVSDNGKWYYTSSNGAMQTGVVKVDNKVYSLSENGEMQKGNVAIEGKTYTFSENGECVSNEAPKPVKTFAIGNTETATNQNLNNSVNNNTVNNNAGTEQKKDSEKVNDSSDKKSSGSKKHHSSSSLTDSDKLKGDVSKLNIEKQDVSFNYEIKDKVEYDVKCEMYDSNNKIVDTVKWSKPDKVNDSKATIFITDILGEMNESDYIVSKIAPKTEGSKNLESEKMQVISKTKMENDVSNTNVTINQENGKYNCIVQGKENFEEGTYVLYGFESEDSAYVKTIYCSGNTNTLEFKNVGSKWIKDGTSKIKLSRIYDAKKVNSNLANCKVQFTDNITIK